MYYIYEMRHTPTNMVYIGRRKLPNGKTPENDRYYGSGSLWKRIYEQHPDECVKEILEVVEDKESADALERLYVSRYKDLYGNKCVNISPGGCGGVDKHTEASRKKMSDAVRGEKHPLFGKHLSEEHKQKIAVSNRGKHHSEAARKKMSESHKGEKNHMFGKCGEENPFFGKPLSEEHKQKISLANKGKKRSEATRKKMSLAKKGRPSPNKGKKMSEEQKKKISETLKNRTKIK